MCPESHRGGPPGQPFSQEDSLSRLLKGIAELANDLNIPDSNLRAAVREYRLRDGKRRKWSRARLAAAMNITVRRCRQLRRKQRLLLDARPYEDVVSTLRGFRGREPVTVPALARLLGRSLEHTKTFIGMLEDDGYLITRERGGMRWWWHGKWEVDQERLMIRDAAGNK